MTKPSGELSSEESIDWADKFYSEFVEIIDPESDHAHPSLVSPNPYPIKQFLATEINRAKEEGRRDAEIKTAERFLAEVEGFSPPLSAWQVERRWMKLANSIINKGE